MGKGRSKYKQAPPAPLTSEHIQRLKSLKASSGSIVPQPNSGFVDPGSDSDSAVRGKKRKASAQDDGANGEKKIKVNKKAERGTVEEQVVKQKEVARNGAKVNVNKMALGVRGSAKEKEKEKEETTSVVVAKKSALKKGKKVEVVEKVDSSSDQEMFDATEEPDLNALISRALSGSKLARQLKSDLLGASDDGDSDDDDNDEFLDSDNDNSVYDSDDDNAASRPIFSDDDNSDSDAEEALTAANIEGLSRRLDATLAADEAGVAAELAHSSLQTNLDTDRIRILGTPDSTADSDLDESKVQTLLAPDITLLRTRITDTLHVLSSFSTLSEPGRSRSDYTTQLLKDICAYYGYTPYLAAKLFHLFPPQEAFSFFEANEKPRPLVIRTNTLKTTRRDLAQALINRGVTLEPVGKWSKVGLQVFDSPVPLGATPEYLAGNYILQAASSFLPVMALAPQEGERILDMAAAPGGKTTYISALMKNTGCVFANDSNRARTKGLVGNIHRLGCKNTIVCNHDARDFPRIIGGFDRVLLDAPCSGTGVIAKDPSVKTSKSEKDFMQLPHLQKQLLLCAIDSVDHASRTGGYVVYSTCSVTVEENEEVVAYALRKRKNVKLVDTGIGFGKEGFTSFRGKNLGEKLGLTRRFYPHMYNVDGFFVAKFKKLGPTVKEDKVGKKDEETVDVIMGEDGEEVAFGGFDDSEDKAYLEKGEKEQKKKRGVNPSADKSKATKPAKVTTTITTAAAITTTTISTATVTETKKAETSKSKKPKEKKEKKKP